MLFDKKKRAPNVIPLNSRRPQLAAGGDGSSAVQKSSDDKSAATSCGAMLGTQRPAGRKMAGVRELEPATCGMQQKRIKRANGHKREDLKIVQQVDPSIYLDGVGMPSATGHEMASKLLLHQQTQQVQFGMQHTQQLQQGMQHQLLLQLHQQYQMLQQQVLQTQQQRFQQHQQGSFPQHLMEGMSSLGNGQVPAVHRHDVGVRSRMTSSAPASFAAATQLQRTAVQQLQQVQTTSFSGAPNH